MPIKDNYYGFAGFLSPSYPFTLRDQNGFALNLTGMNIATMTFELVLPTNTGNTVIQGTGSLTFVDASKGIVNYQWAFQDMEAMSSGGVYDAYAYAQLPGDSGPRGFYVGSVFLAVYPGGAPVSVQDTNLDQVNGQNIPNTVNGISVPNGTVPVIVIAPSRVNAQSGDFVAGSIVDLATAVTRLTSILTALQGTLTVGGAVAVNTISNYATENGNLAAILADTADIETNTGLLALEAGGNLALAKADLDLLAGIVSGGKGAVKAGANDIVDLAALAAIVSGGKGAVKAGAGDFADLATLAGIVSGAKAAIKSATNDIVDLATLLARHTDTFGNNTAISAATTFGAIPLVSALAANSFATLINSGYQDTFLVQINVASAFVGTIGFYGLLPDGTTLQQINAHQRGTATSTNATAINTGSALEQTWEGSIAAFKAVYAVCSAFTSGAASIQLGLTAASYAHAILNTVSVLMPDSFATGTVTNDLDAVAITCPGGQATAYVNITGNNVGTLLFEGTPDGGTTWNQMNAVAVGGSTVATQTTTTGAWRINVSGLTSFHVKLHPTTSGTASIRINLSQGVHNVAVTNATALGQNVMVNSAPVVLPSDQSPIAMNFKQIGGNTLNAGTTDGANPTNLLETALGLYTSGGPVDSTGKPQQLSFDRLRTWQGKGIGGGSTNITATVAGDTNLVFGSAPKTIMPGQAVVLAVGGGNAVEIVYVSSSYTPSSTATSIPLQAPVVLANSTTARWDTFAIGGPSTTSMLHTGLLPVMLVGYDANNGSPSAVLMASLDGRSGASILEATPGLLNTAGTVDRQRGNLDNVSLINAAAVTTTQTSADQVNYNERGIIVVLDMTTVGTGSVTLTIQGKDPVSGKYYTLLAGTAITTISTNVYFVYPGATETANVSTAKPVPRTWNVIATANNANATTYKVSVSVIV